MHLTVLLKLAMLPAWQVGPENVNVYSTHNSEWPVLDTFKTGSVLEIKTVMRFHHWVGYIGAVFTAEICSLVNGTLEILSYYTSVQFPKG